MAHPGQHAARRPDDPAVIMAGEDRDLIWKELDRAAVAVANAWYDLGLRPGDPVAWCLENRPEFIVLIWAAQYSGLRYTPLLGLPREEAVEIARRPLPESSEQLLPTAGTKGGQEYFISRRTPP